MSDLGRKNVSDKINETLTPDSEKSNFDKARETVGDKIDDVAAKATPDNQKSFSQTVVDNVKQGHDDAKSEVHKNQSTLADTANEYFDVAKEQAANAAHYISGVVTGATEGAKKGDELSK